MPGNERATLIEMVRALRPRTILEIGTHLGLLSNDMISVCPRDTFLVTLDLPKERWSEARYNYDKVQADYIDKPREKMDFPHPGSALITDPRFRKRIAQIEADSGSFDFSPFYGKMDVVVVDGNHTVPAALHDLQVAMKLVSPGGIIFIDDANKPFRLEGVSLAIYLQSFLQGKTFYWANWQNGPQGNLAFYVNTPEATNKENIDPKLQSLVLKISGFS
jgi:SAM-dependent methyltransferase